MTDHIYCDFCTKFRRNSKWLLNWTNYHFRIYIF